LQELKDVQSYTVALKKSEAPELKSISGMLMVLMPTQRTNHEVMSVLNTCPVKSYPQATTATGTTHKKGSTTFHSIKELILKNYFATKKNCSTSNKIFTDV